MIKRSLLILFLLFVSLNAWSFEYAGFGLGPAISLKGAEATHFILQGEWQPHKVIGSKLIVGFGNGFWLGVALNFKQDIMKVFDISHWDVYVSIPFIYNIGLNNRTVFLGFSVGTTFSFGIDSKGSNHFYLTPLEIRAMPFVWNQFPSSGWDTSANVSYVCMVGYRKAI